MTGSPFSRRRAAVSFSFRVADSFSERASWLRLMRVPLGKKLDAEAGQNEKLGA
jgi:hypothetical protein